MIEIRYLSAPEFTCTQVIIAAGSDVLVLRPSEVWELIDKLKQDCAPLAAALMSEKTSTPEIYPFVGLSVMLAGPVEEA